MKTLLVFLSVLVSALTAQSQSKFAGEWFAIRTPSGPAAQMGYVRTLTWMTIENNGAIYGEEYSFGDTYISSFTGLVTSTGSLWVTDDNGVTLRLRFTPAGRGSGSGSWTNVIAPTPKLLRETWTIVRDRVR